MKMQIVDTGPLVAYLDASDPERAQVISWLDQSTGLLSTTSAVITEAMYFVAALREGPPLLAELVEGTGIRVFDFTQPSELHAAAALMARYADTSMDFADATLVLLAERLNVTEIATLDRRGFSVFRTSKGKRFRLVLDS